MGSCHYADSVTTSGPTGSRPHTPLTDQYSSSMGDAALATFQFVVGVSTISGIRPPGGNLSDVDARKWYLKQESKIADLIDSDLSLEEQARQAFDLRNFYRNEARNLMSDRQGAINLMVKEPNMNWEQIMNRKANKGLYGDDAYLDIIRSSATSRTSVNVRLGLDRLSPR
jgi:hypothetical protein